MFINIPQNFTIGLVKLLLLIKEYKMSIFMTITYVNIK